MSLLDGLFSGTNISDDTRGTAANALQALGAGLLSGDRYQPIGPGFNQTLALAQKGSPKAALKQILMQAGYSEADAEKLSANEAVAKLAIDQKREEGFGNLVNGAFGGGASPSGATSAPRVSPDAPSGPASGASLNGGPALTGSIGDYAKAIQSNESGGNYQALGPVTRTGDRAYGAYQVMGANVPQWTKEALGQSMTPEQFLQSKEAQDKVFQHRFGGYVEKYGNPQDAASAWFTGRPQSQGGSSRDVLGTTGNSYVAKFNNALARVAGQTPARVADAGSAAAPQPATANDGMAIQTELGPVAFTPSATPGPAGQQDNPADVPNTGAQPVGFNVPPAPGSQPAQQPANATQNAARIRLQNEVNQTLALIARTGMYGDRGKALAEALKLKIAPLQKYLEPTDIERTLAAADAASPEAAAIIRNSITDARPTSVREFEYARGTPGFEEYQRRMAEAGRSTVTIGGAEKAYDSEQGKTYAELMKEVQAAGRNASTRIANLSEARRLLDTPGFVAGIGTDRFALPAKQLIAKLGGDPSAPANMETFRALSNKAVTDALGGSLGAGVSNADVAFLQRQNTSLDNSIPANKQLIDYATRLTERQTKVAEFAREYAKKNGGRLDVGYDQALAEWAAANPVFPEARSESQGGQQGSGQRQPPPQMNTTDRAMSLRNARDALKRNPGARDAILQRLRDAGLPTDGL